MEKAIKLLSYVNEHNFIDLFYVTQRIGIGVYSLESIMFFNEDDAKHYCDYLNNKHKTTKYIVSKTNVHVQ